jgi:hypothetical protein
MNTIIKDPVLEPFFIVRDKYNYSVMETIIPQEKYLEPGSKGNPYEKAVGHYGSLGNALKSIAKGRLDGPELEYSSVKDYLDRHEELLNEMKRLLKELKL